MIDAQEHVPSDVSIGFPSNVATPPTSFSSAATGAQSFFFFTWFGVARSASTPSK